jgi:uncharacterized membrane protein YjjP (DUF1212 family)
MAAMKIPLETQEKLAEEEALLSCILDMGELLLTSGAEVMRVEDTISRLCHVYDFPKYDVFTITSSIVLTVQTPGGRMLTQTRRIRARDTDLGRVERVNALSRRLCANPVPLEQFQNSLDQIRQASGYPAPVLRIMYIMISAAFSLFFGGTLGDAAAGAITGLVLFEMLRLCAPLRLNGTIQCILASFVTGIAAVLLYNLGLGQNPDKIIIGNIMLLIPGIAFTTALRDIINGDTLSGLLGLCEAILRALAVAIGFAAVLLLTGG